MNESPRDQFSRYDTITRNFTVATTATDIVLEDPDRVVLMFGQAGSGTVRLRPNANATTSTGYGQGTTTVPLILTHQLHGHLTQVRWSCISTMGTNIEVTEVFLRRWPTRGRRDERSEPGNEIGRYHKRVIDWPEQQEGSSSVQPSTYKQVYDILRRGGRSR